MLGQAERGADPYLPGGRPPGPEAEEGQLHQGPPDPRPQALRMAPSADPLVRGLVIQGHGDLGYRDEGAKRGGGGGGGGVGEVGRGSKGEFHLRPV